MRSPVWVQIKTRELARYLTAHRGSISMQIRHPNSPSLTLPRIHCPGCLFDTLQKLVSVGIRILMTILYFQYSTSNESKKCA